MISNSMSFLCHLNGTFLWTAEYEKRNKKKKENNNSGVQFIYDAIQSMTQDAT